MIVAADESSNLVLEGVWVALVSAGDRSLLLVYLSAVEHVLEQAVVQIDLGQLLKLLLVLLAQVFDYEGQELLCQVKVVNEYLEEVFDAHLLVALNRKLFVELVRVELLLVVLCVLA